MTAHRTRVLMGLLAMALAASTWTSPTAVAGTSGESFLVVKEDDLPSNAELVVRLVEVTPFANPARVVISRDDDFADALASGVLQSESPLLLVPRTGPIPGRVLQEIRRLGASEATILGGDQAVTDEIAAQLTGEGLDVDRLFGDSRFETAVEIARSSVPDATTAILARAAAADPGNPTQGFADALGAGALSAENRWPVLLTSTSTLTRQTRDYIAESDIEEIKIVGGTSAVSAEVEAELLTMVDRVERIAGDSRAATAVEVAKEFGAESLSDVDRVVLVDGSSPDGFAGGFAAAGHAAAFDAPILLSDGIMLPPETRAFLEPGAAFAQAGDPIAITCVVHPLACDTGRQELGLIDIPLLDVTPRINSLVTPGQVVELSLSPSDEGAEQPVTVKGSCVDGQQDLVTDSAGIATFVLSSSPPPFSTCSVDITYGDPDAPLSQGYSYALVPDAATGSGATISSGIFSYGTTVPSTPLYVADRLECTGPAGTVSQEDSTYLARYIYPDFFVESFSLTSFPLEAQPGDTCTATAQVPEGVSRVLWGVYSWSDHGLRNPLVLGRGTEAAFSFADLGSVADVNVVWILETNSPDIGVPPSPPEGLPGQVFNPQNLSITCDGVLLEPDLNVTNPGATCDVGAPSAGQQVLVVEPGSPLAPSPTATFSSPTSGFTSAVYTVVTDPSANAQGQGGADGCAGAPELPYSEIAPGLTNPSSPSAYRSFLAFEGEALRFRADATLGESEEVLDPVLTVYDPSGAVLASNDDGDSGVNSRIDVVIPAEGTYCVEVSGYGGTTGDFLLVVDPSAAFVADGVLSAEVPFETFTFTGDAGTPLVVEMRAPGFEVTDPVLEMYDSAGNQVAFDDDGGGYPNARLQISVPFADTFTIVASAFEGSYGPYLFEASFPTAPQTAFAAD